MLQFHDKLGVLRGKILRFARIGGEVEELETRGAFHREWAASLRGADLGVFVTNVFLVVYNTNGVVSKNSAGGDGLAGRQGRGDLPKDDRTSA